MNRLAIALGALLIAFCGMDGAKAQTQVQPFYGVISPTGAKGMQGVDYLHGLPIGAVARAACGGQSLTAGIVYPITQDLTGTLCTGSGGGGGGTAVTVANGADVAEGSTTDIPATVPTDATAATTIALLKALNNSNIAPVPAGTNNIGTFTLPSGASTSALQTTGNTALTTINTTLGSPFQAGGSIGNTSFGAVLAAETTKVIGTVNQGTSPWVVSGTLTPSGTQAVSAASGAFASGSLASGSMVDIGSQADAACGTGTGTCSLIALTKYLNTVAILPTAISQTTPGTTNGVVITPSSAVAIGITPIVSAAGESSHVLKASAGNTYSVYATNLTATQGFLLILNSTTAPADGAVTPLACAPLAPNGIASINYAPGPPGVFSTGITAVVTSAVTCFTKTTGVITAFISGSVQ